MEDAPSASGGRPGRSTVEMSSPTHQGRNAVNLHAVPSMVATLVSPFGKSYRSEVGLTTVGHKLVDGR